MQQKKGAHSLHTQGLSPVRGHLPNKMPCGAWPQAATRAAARDPWFLTSEPGKARAAWRPDSTGRDEKPRWAALSSLSGAGGGAAPSPCIPRRASSPRAPASPARHPRPAPRLHWSGGCASGGPGGDPDLRRLKAGPNSSLPFPSPFVAHFLLPFLPSSLASPHLPRRLRRPDSESAANPEAARTARRAARRPRLLPALPSSVRPRRGRRNWPRPPIVHR